MQGKALCDCVAGHSPLVKFVHMFSICFIMLCMHMCKCSARARNGVRHVECKAECGKGPGAALSTWSMSCQGETLKDTWDILTVWTANLGPGKVPGTA